MNGFFLHPTFLLNLVKFYNIFRFIIMKSAVANFKSQSGIAVGNIIG